MGGVNLFFVDDWQIVVNEDVIPDTKAPESTVEDAVIVRGFQGVGVTGNNLKMTSRVLNLACLCSENDFPCSKSGLFVLNVFVMNH